jgi:hypothetical protein
LLPKRFGGERLAARRTNRWPAVWTLVIERVRQDGKVSDARPDGEAQPGCDPIAVALGGLIVSVVTSLLLVAQVVG